MADPVNTLSRLMATPIADEAGAVAFLQALVDAGKCWHLDDDPCDVSDGRNPLFTLKECELVRQRLREMYALPVWTDDDCPISRMMDMEAVKAGHSNWEAMRDAQYER